MPTFSKKHVLYRNSTPTSKLVRQRLAVLLPLCNDLHVQHAMTGWRMHLSMLAICCAAASACPFAGAPSAHRQKQQAGHHRHVHHEIEYGLAHLDVQQCWALHNSHLQHPMRNVGDKRIRTSLQRRVHHRLAVAGPNMDSLPSGVRGSRHRR